MYTKMRDTTVLINEGYVKKFMDELTGFFTEAEKKAIVDGTFEDYNGRLVKWCKAGEMRKQRLENVKSAVAKGMFKILEDKGVEEVLLKKDEITPDELSEIFGINKNPDMSDLSDHDWAKIHGHRAGKRGDAHYVNPYARGTEHHRIWHDHWKQAKTEHLVNTMSDLIKSGLNESEAQKVIDRLVNEDKLDEGFSRAHFQSAVNHILSHPEGERESLANAHSKILGSLHPRFNSSRFHGAVSKGKMYNEKSGLPNLTRKHMQAVADHIKGADPNIKHTLGKHYTSMFKRANPRFDENRFKAAAGLNEDKGNPEHPDYGNKYDPVSVNKAIDASNRAGRKIGGKQAKMIHALLKGRAQDWRDKKTSNKV